MPREDEILEVANKVRKFSKPLIIAANKCDLAPPENIERLKELKD